MKTQTTTGTKALNAFSYIRWSSADQTGNDSFLRQSKAAKVATDNGWNLINLPPDKGVSAFRGKNLSHKGILGQFLAKVERKEIETPCVLIVEALHRFSRTEIEDILPLFINILKSGIEVYSCADGVHYTRAALKENPMLIGMQILMGFAAANAYAKNLSSMITSAKQGAIANAKNGKSANIGGMAPVCFTFQGEKQNGKYIVNEKSAIVQRIFREYATGNSSLHSICDKLNADNVPTFRSGSMWQAASVKHILEMKSVTGEFKGNKGFFPQIVSVEVFNQCQVIMNAKRIGAGKKSTRTNIFKGLVRCVCNRPMVQTSSSRDNKPPKYYFRCNASQIKGCKCKNLVRMDDLELEVFAFVMNADPSSMISSHNKELKNEINQLKTEIAEITANIKKLITLGLDMPDIKAELSTLNAKRNELQSALAQKQAQQSVASASGQTPTDIRAMFARVAEDHEAEYAKENPQPFYDIEENDFYRSIEDGLENEAIRQGLVTLLPSLIKSIHLNSNDYSYQVEWIDGNRSDRMELEYVERH